MNPVLAYEALGYATWWGLSQPAEKVLPWYVEVPAAVGGAALANRYNLGTRAAAVRTGQYVWGVTGKALGHAGRYAAGTRAAVATRAAAFTVASYTAAVAAGYVIGAVVGTAVSHAIWGKSGSQTSMDFYTGKGKYGEYFDIVGNVQTIYNALHQGDI